MVCAVQYSVVGALQYSEVCAVQCSDSVGFPFSIFEQFSADTQIFVTGDKPSQCKLHLCTLYSEWTQIGKRRKIQTKLDALYLNISNLIINTFQLVSY